MTSMPVTQVMQTTRGLPFNCPTSTLAPDLSVKTRVPRTVAMPQYQTAKVSSQPPLAPAAMTAPSPGTSVVSQPGQPIPRVLMATSVDSPSTPHQSIGMLNPQRGSMRVNAMESVETVEANQEVLKVESVELAEATPEAPKVEFVETVEAGPEALKVESVETVEAALAIEEAPEVTLGKEEVPEAVPERMETLEVEPLMKEAPQASSAKAELVVKEPLQAPAVSVATLASTKPKAPVVKLAGCLTCRGGRRQRSNLV